MGNKFSPVVASNSTAGDRLLYGGQAAIHLSTGDLVMLVTDPSQSDPNKVSLYVVASHTTPSIIATLNAITVTPTSTNTANFRLDHALPQCLALCRDASDNLYVIGAYGNNGGTFVGVQAYLKQGGLVWQQQPVCVCTTSLTTAIPPVGYSAVWCNSG